MTDDRKRLWEKFTRSGAISDYLKFKDAGRQSNEKPATDFDQSRTL